MRIYLRAGLYAEGPSDYQFLCRLLDRLIDTLGAALFAGAYDVADTIGIDAPGQPHRKRAERILDAVTRYDALFELLVIHTDAAGDADNARITCVNPAMAAVRAARPGRPFIAVACIPVREIEAWMLADPAPFRTLLGSGVLPALPSDPEKEIDPKATLRRILKEGGHRRTPESIYALFGDGVRIPALRALSAFQTFEAELTDALRQVAKSQGHPG